jgi:hypothetical protein
MAKDIGGVREPGEEGTKVGGQIQTPMCPTNVGRKNTPKILTYESTMDTKESGGSSSIMGPGTKNKY